jgi:hypothetical protein
MRRADLFCLTRPATRAARRALAGGETRTLAFPKLIGFRGRLIAAAAGCDLLCRKSIARGSAQVLAMPMNDGFLPSGAGTRAVLRAGVQGA